MPKRILSITLLSLPFIFFIYLTVSIGNDKGAFLTGGTSTAIQGGMFYPLMQISAWGLYNIWSPRAILSFYPYFFENPYRILSIALTASLIYFLYKNRKFTPIFFVLFLAFFAKGPNPPFGDLFSFIINYFPFGYMIRSPDSKFGAFIAAWFVVAIYYLHPKQKLIITTLATLFLISNLVGMYANGAISSSKGDQKTTTFIQDPEAELIIGLIEKHTNAVVIGNFPSCAGEWYEDKFHTCQGILIKNLKRHTIQAPGHQLFEVIKNYKEFPLLLLINKRQKESENFAPARLSKKGFEKIYNTSNYELFFRDVSNENCENLHNFSCIKKQKNIIVSIPESAFRFYYPEISYEIINGMVSPSLEPPKFNEERRLIFFWLYIICYVLCLVALFKIYFTRYSHFN